jgi:hypothetical protein
MATMTVGELMDRLKELPRDAPVHIEEWPSKGPGPRESWEVYDIAGGQKDEGLIVLMRISLRSPDGGLSQANGTA